MPVADPTSGPLFIWLVSCFLFTCITAGGIFLLLYLVLPQNEATSWLPIAGVTLVCLPWIFWFITCFYRIVSRALGVRMVLGCGSNSGGNARARSNVLNTSASVASREPEKPDSPLESAAQEGDGRHVQFGEAVVLGEGDDEHEKNANLRSLSTSISSNNLSIDPHKSEMPLTSDKAS